MFGWAHRQSSVNSLTKWQISSIGMTFVRFGAWSSYGRPHERKIRTSYGCGSDDSAKTANNLINV